MAEAWGALSVSGGRSDCACQYMATTRESVCLVYLIKYDANHEATARTARNVFSVAHVRNTDLQRWRRKVSGCLPVNSVLGALTSNLSPHGHGWWYIWSVSS